MSTEIDNFRHISPQKSTFFDVYRPKSTQKSTFFDIYRHRSTQKSTFFDIYRHISTQKSTFFDIYRQISTKIGTDRQSIPPKKCRCSRWGGTSSIRLEISKIKKLANESKGGEYDVNNRLNRDWTPKFATKDYVFVSFHIFLKKMAFWRRAWSLEISRGRSAAPNARFRRVRPSRDADVAVAEHSRPVRYEKEANSIPPFLL